MIKVKEFKTCIEYELNDSSHIFRCKGCSKDFPKSFNAARHAHFCKDYQNYTEDYSRFYEDFNKYYITENLSLSETAIKMQIDKNFALSIMHELNINKDDKDRLERKQINYKNTCKERFGTEYALQSSEVKEKSKSTWMKKYGVDNPTKSEQIRLKTQQTCLNRYGVLHVCQSPIVKDKIVQTNIKNHGVEYCLQLQEVKDRGKETSLKKYGTEHPMQSEEIKAKVRKTNNVKYGVSCSLQNEQVKSKIIETNIKRYGVPYHCMTDVCINANGRIISKLNKAFAEYLKESGIESEFEFHLGKNSYDIHILNSNILIEINPTYTHNSTCGPIFKNHQKDPISSDYHLNKTNLAIRNNYHCIHIFDWESWDKIISIINPHKKRIYARNCEIKEISVKECDTFLNKYHLQGTCRNQKIRLGLYFDDSLVQLMTFGKPRYNKNYQWELLRLCSSSAVMIVGGSQKLFNYFMKNYDPESIISYCDKSKFSGDVYHKLGFELKNETAPTPHWFNGEIHITDNLLRQRGADQLIGTNYGKGTNNEEIMINHGFVKVFDCGQSVYTWKN